LTSAAALPRCERRQTVELMRLQCSVISKESLPWPEAMARKLHIHYPGVMHDVRNRGDQREALFGVGPPRMSGSMSATGEENRQVQSEAQGSLET
jgi:hypothetical protein